MSTESNTDFINKIKEKTYGGFNAIEYADGGLEVYLSFKALLEWTNSNVNLFSDTEELIKIDFESDKPMFMFSTSLSANLQKCYIRNTYLNTTQGTLFRSPRLERNATLPAPFNDISAFNQSRLRTLKESLDSDGQKVSTDSNLTYIFPTIGNINNIYINAAFLSGQLHKLSDNESNKVSIREFLQSICDGVTKALGSVNDLQVVGDVDGIQNILTIVDFQQVRIKGLSKSSNVDQYKAVTIQAQGLKSMVTNISAQSSITPDLATVISTGAQAQGEVLGEEAVSFSRLSKGLTDRVYPSKQIGEQVKVAAVTKKEERAKKALSKFEGNLDAYAKLALNQQPGTDGIFSHISLESNSKEGMENIPVELYKYLLGAFTETNQTSTGFIPIKLNLSIYGISGIKIFQKFKITDDVLPFSYDQKYDFTVTGVSHTIDNSKWITTISSIMGLEALPADRATRLSNEEAFAPQLNLEKTQTIAKPDKNDKQAITILTVNATKKAVINGEVPAEYMRELNKELFPYNKWKGSTLTSDKGRIRLLRPVMSNLEKMLTAYSKDNPNTPMRINSAYRTFENQVAIKDLWLKAGDGAKAATAGTSKHGFGMAIDFANSSGTKLKVDMSQYKWLKVNAGKYGFKRLPNWKDKKDLENWEAWHWQNINPGEIKTGT